MTAFALPPEAARLPDPYRDEIGVVNALAHVGASARLRVYNPGLVTSILIFLPLGLLTIATIAAQTMSWGPWKPTSQPNASTKG